MNTTEQKTDGVLYDFIMTDIDFVEHNLDEYKEGKNLLLVRCVHNAIVRLTKKFQDIDLWLKVFYSRDLSFRRCYKERYWCYDRCRILIVSFLSELGYGYLVNYV